MKTRDGPESRSDRKWYEYWPLLIILIEIILNTDWVVTPILIKRGVFFDFSLLPINWDLSWLIPELSNFGVFVWVSVVSIITSLGWYWLWGWLAKVIIETVKEKESIQEAVGISRKIIFALRKGGLLELVKEWFTDTFNWATDNNNRWLKFLKRGGYMALFVISALPVSGGRLVATIFCRSADPVKGLTLLILGETLKNAFMVYGFWNLVFWIFSK